MTAEVRRLTPSEVQRLQGFNEGHLDVNNQGDSAKYSETGNSWAVNNARFVIKGVHKADERITGKKRGFKYGTISSGVEAHTQSVAGLGDKAVFFSEISPAPCGVLAAHYPEVPNLGDMTLVDYDAEKKVIHNRPYDGYTEPDKTAMGFVPYKTEKPVEIPAEYGETDLVSGGTPCFTKGSFVLTEDGYRPIEEIKVGDTVVTHLGNLRKVVRVGHKMSDNVYRIKIHNRPSFRVTGNHPFWTGDVVRKWNNTIRGWESSEIQNVDWRTVDAFSANTYCALLNWDCRQACHTPKFPLVYDANVIQIAELAGWYLGDGYIRQWKGKAKKAVILCLNQKKLEIFRERFGAAINFTECKSRTAVKVQICCTALANFLSETFGEISCNKRIPVEVMSWDRIYTDALVRGYFFTDGCEAANGKRFTTTSAALAYGIADLIGKTSISFFERPSTCVIEGRTVNQHSTWTVAAADKPRTFHPFERWDFAKVSEIAQDKPDTVYNLEVEDDHSYVCNGFCVHNCQSVSIAGKRHGMSEGSGTRSSLAFQLPRIGAAVGAKYIVWENVAGAFSSNGGKDFAWLLHRMTEYGYTSLAWRCMDAQYIRTDRHPRAVPQRRRRVWIVGYRGNDWRVPCSALFEPMSALGDVPPTRTVGVGYLRKFAANTDVTVPTKTELEEFKDFLAGASPKILNALAQKGICDSAESRLAELTKESQAAVTGDAGLFFGDDLFGSACPAAEKHQGRGLKEADLELHFPESADIRALPQYKVFQWAKSVCKDVCYFGEMFSPYEGGEATVADLQPKLLENIGNAGFLCNGLVCTMKMPEWNAGVTEEELAQMPTELAELYDGDVCGLSDVLDECPDPKYKLSWRGCYGVLRRTGKRGKRLPIELGYALVERIVEQAEFVKWAAVFGKDTVKKDGGVSERQIAIDCFNDFVSSERKWDDVVEAEQTKTAEGLAREDYDDSDDGEDRVNPADDED